MQPGYTAGTVESYNNGKHGSSGFIRSDDGTRYSIHWGNRDRSANPKIPKKGDRLVFKGTSGGGVRKAMSWRHLHHETGTDPEQPASGDDSPSAALAAMSCVHADPSVQA